jgi:hypothetical protein
MPDEVVFNPKASWQKDNCLFCDNEAVLQAECGSSAIRCCDDEECMQKAAEMAQRTAKAIGQR